jgi:tetratricopeptide (TPR) repeat protein
MTARFHPVLSGGLILLLLVSCARYNTSKIDGVVKGFFEQVDQQNLETAKAEYLTKHLASQPDTTDEIKRKFGMLVGKLKSVEVTDQNVKGEFGAVTATVQFIWGSKLRGRVELIKEEGHQWRISEFKDFKGIGAEYLGEGMRLCENKNLPGGVEKLNAALAQNPEDAMYVALIGGCYLTNGDLTNAEVQLKRAINMAPGWFGGYAGLAELYGKQGKLGEAEEAAEKAIKLEPDDASLYRQLALLYAENGLKLERAVELCEKALALAPEDAQNLDALGWVYYRKGDREQAVRYFTRARQKAPGDATIQKHYLEVTTTAQTHINNARQALAWGRYDQALEECDAALRKEATNPASVSCRSQVLEQLARQHLGRAERLYESQQYQRALAECDSVLEHDPQNEAAQNLRTRIQETMRILGASQ